MKYIVTVTEDGVREIFVFPRSVHHSAMAEAVARIKEVNGPHDWRRITRTPVSAGFVDNNGVCHGKSESLRLESSAEDTALLGIANVESPSKPAFPPNQLHTEGALRMRTYDAG